MNINLSEDMVSNLRQFNNCGSFTLTVNGTAYAVKYDAHSRKIETDAPESIRDALVRWWFV